MERIQSWVKKIQWEWTMMLKERWKIHELHLPSPPWVGITCKGKVWENQKKIKRTGCPMEPLKRMQTQGVLLGSVGFQSPLRRNSQKERRKALAHTLNSVIREDRTSYAAIPQFVEVN